MASLREVLAFIITADAGQAIREFDKLEGSATKSLGAMEGSTILGKSSAQWTRWGAIAGGVAITAGAGLVKAASNAADLDKSMARVKATFGSSAPAVEKWAKNANSVFLSDRQASSYAAAVGEAAQGLGLASDAAAKLVPNAIGVASQLAVLKGVDVAASMESVAAALRGEYDATQRLIPALSAQRIQQEALKASGKSRVTDLTNAEKAQATLNIIISDGTKILDGNSKALDSPSAKWATLKSQLDDVITSLGGGALDVFGPALTGISKVADAFSQLPPAVSGTIGTVAAAGVGLSALVSIGSFAATGFLKLKSAVGTFNDALLTSEGSVSTFGAAVSSVSGVAAAAIGIKAADAALVSLVDSLDAAAFAQNQLNAAAGKSDWSRQITELRKALEPSMFDTFKASVSQIFGGGIVNPKDNAVLGKMNDELKRTFDTLVSMRELLTADEWAQFSKQFLAGLSGDELKNAKALLADAEKEAAAAAAGAAKGQKDLAGANKDGAAAAGGAADATGKQVDATKALDDALKNGKTALETWAANLNVLAEGGKAAAQAIDLSTTTDDLIANASKMGAAVVDFRDGLGKLPATIDQTKLAMGGYTDEQVKSIDAMSKLADQNQAYVEGLIASNTPAEQVLMHTTALNDLYGKQLKAAGLTTEQIKTYQHTLGLTPAQVLTAIKLSGDAEAKAKLTLITDQLKLLDKPYQMKITQQILAGDYIGAARTAQQGTQAYMNEHPVKVPVIAVLGGRLKQGNSQDLAQPVIDKHPEIPGIQLQSVEGPTAAPLSLTNVTVNMPAGVNGNDVVRAVRRHQARNGTAA